MKQIYLLFLCCLLIGELSAQIYEDHYGAGHTSGMEISSSGDTADDKKGNVVSGPVNILTLEESARFLSQATLGASYEDIEYLQTKEAEPWIDEQLAIAPGSFLERMEEILIVYDSLQVNSTVSGQILDFTFYDYLMNRDDALRQRMAFAWSQILVGDLITSNTNINKGCAQYYDILYQNAFGNYRDMLFEVTMSMNMGRYLSHFMNRKEGTTVLSDGTEEKSLPDENFAREIMQLFTIGVHELNMDGSVKLNPDGTPVQTYDIDDVAELAKVFTGLSCSKKIDGSDNGSFFIKFADRNYVAPMKMFGGLHDTGTKQIIDLNIPARQTGMEDINQVLDYLFNHPNVGPFLSRTMIQHLVTSNPSPNYIQRVATIFNDNGAGVRGDLEAMTKAILLDPEAQECGYIENISSGKLIQPIERFTSLFKAFDLQTPSNRFFLNDSEEYYQQIGQGFHESPSVFNFFTPSYSEDKTVAPLGLVSPEFQILNTVTAIAYINKIETSLKEQAFSNRTGPGIYLKDNASDKPFFDFSDEIKIYRLDGVEKLLDRLDILLCRGQLSDTTKAIIANTIQTNEAGSEPYTNRSAVLDAIYYIMLSPDYIIQL